ncbi:MAG: acyltransferase [Kofleriaceae bacterium]
MAAPASSNERIEFIQALRGIAALAVVMFHVRIWIAGPAFLDIGPRLFENGAAGVDLFFVISGFIMVHTTWEARGGIRNAARFFAKRFARIWPVYVVAALAFVLATGEAHKWFATSDGLATYGKSLVFYPGKHGPPFFGWTPNGVGWTLNYEIWFYVLFAVAMLAGRRRWYLLCGLFVAFLIVIPYAYTGTVSANAYFSYDMVPSLLNLLGNSMVWEFLAGCAIGAIYKSGFRIQSREFLGTFAVLAVTATIWQQLSMEWNRQGLTGWGPMMMILVLALALYDKRSPIRVHPWLLWLGDISFSLYLWHRVAQLGILRLLPEAHPSLHGGFGFVIGTTVVALVLAHFSYRYLELGLSKHVRRWLLRRIG